MVKKENDIVVKQAVKNDLKTASERYVQAFEKEARTLMESFGLEFKAEVKQAIFNLTVACEKALKDKKISWENVNKDGLASKLLYYAQLNLNPASNELYIIPYEIYQNGKGTGIYTLNFEESYLGKKKKVKTFSCDNLVDTVTFLVREEDIYEPEIDVMNGDTLVYKPKPFNDNPVIGAVCYLKYSEFSRNKIVEMTAKELEKVKQASVAKMNGKLSPSWSNWEGEMQKKAVLKRALKDVEINVPAEYQNAFIGTEQYDNENYDIDIIETLPEKKEVVIDAGEKKKMIEDIKKEQEKSNEPYLVEFE